MIFQSLEEIGIRNAYWQYRAAQQKKEVCQKNTGEKFGR
jgi:hypothetical protein